MTIAVRPVLLAFVVAALASCDGDRSATPPRGEPRLEVTAIRDSVVVGTFENTTDLPLVFASNDDALVDHLEVTEALERGLFGDCFYEWAVVAPGDSVPFEAKGWYDGFDFRVVALYRYGDWPDGEYGVGEVATRVFASGELGHISTNGRPPQRPRVHVRAYDASTVLRELGGRTVSWIAFEDGVEVRRSFDCGAASPAKQRLSVEIQLLEPDAEGFATADDGFAIERIRWYLHGHLDGHPLGSVSRPGSVTLHYAVNGPSEAVGEDSGLRRSWKEHDLRIALVDDRDGRFYREELVPPAYVRLLLAHDGDSAVPRAELLGDQRDEERPVVHEFLFDEEAAARAFARELGRVELDVTEIGRRSDRTWLGLELIGTLDDATLEARTRDLGRRALRLGGDYVAWSAPIVPRSPSPVVEVGTPTPERR